MNVELVFNRVFPASTGINPVADICTMNLNGSNLQRLTINPPGEEWDCYGPKWSPDGTKILFSSYSRRPSVRWADVYIMDADGTNRVMLTDGPYQNDGASWSPDGTEIVYTRVGEKGAGDIYIMSADGSNKHQLTSSPLHDDYAPAWSAKGIVFLRTILGGMGDLFLINPDRSNEHQLTSLGKLLSEPAWSPDATRIAFPAYNLNPDLGMNEIYSIDASTRTDLIMHTPSDAVYESVCYSPDGTKLILSSNRLGPASNIFIFDLSTSTWSQLTFGIENDFGIDWK